MERETGIEPATNSLEGCDSTIELLPHSAGRGTLLLYAVPDLSSKKSTQVIGAALTRRLGTVAFK
jgi:hypothetical protein